MLVARCECEFYLLRYVPDPVRNEYVHIGVILQETGEDAGKFGNKDQAGRPLLRFTSDWRRVRCLDPDADTGMLESLESELRQRFQREASGTRGGLFRLIEESFSNCVQITPAKAYLAESMETGVEELMRLYVEPLKRERVSRLSGRAAIQARMRTDFERAGVWDLMRKRIDASLYTRPGDPLRLDLGYRPEPGVLKMFQAVSLETGASISGLEMAKVLAFSAPSLMAGVERVERARLELTAVVEPLRRKAASETAGDRTGNMAGNTQGNSRIGEQGTGSDGRQASRPGDGWDDGSDDGWDQEHVEAYRFAVETMEEHRIRVMTTADLGRMAETARRELLG
jgi:hypothetical protein